MAFNDVETTVQTRLGYAEHSVMRLSLDYFLRVIHQTSVTFDGDLVGGIIFIALIRANAQHLAEAVQMEFSQSHGIIPDAFRRPVSVKSISDSLNLPYETVRRRIGELCAQGYCDRLPGRGFIVPERVLRRPEFITVLARNYSNFQQLLGRLQRTGVEVPGQAPRTPGGHGREGASSSLA